MITPSHLHGVGQAVSLGDFPRIALSVPHGVLGGGTSIAQRWRFLPDCQSPLSTNVETVFTLQRSTVSLTPRHSLAKRTSKSSSATPFRNCANIGLTCHDEGSRLRGGDNDFENPICDCVVGIVSASRYGGGVIYLWTVPRTYQPHQPYQRA
jgi:hypothetical protein